MAQKVTLKQINDFIASEPIALAGASRNEKKFGYAVLKELKQKGLKVIPVNPNAVEILGEKAYPSVKSLPPEVKSLIILTKSNQTASVVKEAKEKGITRIWIQQSSDSKEALAELEGSGIEYITGQCILMYYKPHSVHKFHGFLKKVFGSFPK